MIVPGFTNVVVFLISFPDQMELYPFRPPDCPFDTISIVVDDKTTSILFSER